MNTGQVQKIEWSSFSPNFKGDVSNLSFAKPRKGQPVYYRGQLRGNIERIEDNIAYYKQVDGETNLFIWLFKDGLNNLHRWGDMERPFFCDSCGSDYEPLCHCINSETQPA